MANYKILDTKPISNVEVLEFLKGRAKEEGEELTYREDKSKTFLKKIVKMKRKDFDKAFEEIKNLNIENITDSLIVQILNILPKNGTELRAILSSLSIILVEESANKILDVVKKYIK